MNEPIKFRAGDTVEWDVSNSDYPASTYTLKYYIRGANALDVTAVADGENYTVTVTADDSIKLPPGIYSYQGRFESGTTHYTPEDMVGTFEVLPNLAAATAGTDARTHARIVLDAVNATLENRASKVQQAISIAGRQLSYMPVAELLMLKKFYENEVKREEAAEKMAKGLSSGKSITFGIRNAS